MSWWLNRCYWNGKSASTSHPLIFPSSTSMSRVFTLRRHPSNFHYLQLKVFHSLPQVVYHYATLIPRSYATSPWISIVHFVLVSHLCHPCNSAPCLHPEPKHCHYVYVITSWLISKWTIHSNSHCLCSSCSSILSTTCLHPKQILGLYLMPLQYPSNPCLHSQAC